MTYPLRPPSTVWYFYPIYQRVSFRSIAEKHCKELRKYFRITTVNLDTFPIVQLLGRPLVLVQPFFYPFQTSERKLKWQLPRTRGLIGFDVADSNHISELGVKLTRYARAMVVPSNHAKTTYVKSGVKVPVHVLPHGVDLEYIEAPKQPPTTFKPLAEKKEKENLKILQCWIPHSAYRKGFDLLMTIYKKLSKEHRNTLLLIKTHRAIGYLSPSITYKGGDIEPYMEWRIDKKWITEQEKMELHDLCDIYLLTSRGGGFEHPALEALARGEPVIAGEGGSWEEFLPKWTLVKSKPSGKVFQETDMAYTIHNGTGVEINVEQAVDKASDMINNLGKYKAKVHDYIKNVIKPRFKWDKIGELLKKIVEAYL